MFEINTTTDVIEFPTDDAQVNDLIAQKNSRIADVLVTCFSKLPAP